MSCVVLTPPKHTLTHALISGVQQFGEGRSGSLGFDGLGRFLVLCQFAQHTSCNALDVFDRRVQQLHKEGDGGA